jgi:putative sporulation protein YyaC
MTEKENGKTLLKVEKLDGKEKENGFFEGIEIIEKRKDGKFFESGEMPEKRKNKPLPVVMCIGSDRVSGDLLGPAVGKKLVEYNLRAYVYGVTGRNINGANIDFYDGFIREVHKDSKVVAVDACLGAEKEIGKIKVGNRGVGAGHAVRKTGKRYGDIGIVGIVAENAEDNVMQLLSVEVSLVEELSARIAEYLAENLERLVGN